MPKLVDVILKHNNDYKKLLTVPQVFPPPYPRFPLEIEGFFGWMGVKTPAQVENIR